MARSRRIPKLCHHKASGRAYVTDPATKNEVWMGPVGSDEANRNYDEWVREFLARAAPTVAMTAGGTVDQLLLVYLKHAESYYRKRGKPTSEVRQTKALAGLIREAGHGRRRVDDFGPAQLIGLRELMVKKGWARSSINADVRRVVRIWRKGVEWDMVSAVALAKLEAVKPLAEGRSPAREPDDVPPVALAVVEATLPHLRALPRDVLRLQLAAGMRPSEALAVRPCDVDRTSEPWRYAVTDDWNKTAHKRRKRTVFLGPAARAVLGPWLAACKRAEDWAFPGRRGGHFSRGRLTDLIAAVCKKHGIEHWHANQLRHTQATAIRARHGKEAAQAVLGHADPRTTEVYAERDLELARRVAEEMC